MIYKIIKYKNYGIISPLPDARLGKTLERMMMYTKQGAEFMPHPEWGIIRLYNIKKGTFPWGFRDLVRRILAKWCDQTGDTFVFDFDRVAPPRLMYHMSLRPYQLEAVNCLLLNKGGLICMPTGSGKTKTMLEYISILKLPTTIIVPTLDIKSQWEKQITSDNVKVINHQSKQAPELIKNSKLIVFDECHHVAAKSIFKLAMAAETDTIISGCSATPRREDGEDMRITGAIGEIIYSITRRELIEQGYLCDAEVRYIDVQYNVEPYLTYAEEYKKYIVENDARNKKILQKAIEEYVNEKKTLILVTQIEQGNTILELLKNHSSARVLYLNGSVKDREFKLDDYDIIIASNIFDEGVDLPALDVLILAGSGKSENRLTQRIGRVLRPSKSKERAIIYDFIDKGKYIGAHYKKRRKALETEFQVIDYD